MGTPSAQRRRKKTKNLGSSGLELKIVKRPEEIDEQKKPYKITKNELVGRVYGLLEDYANTNIMPLTPSSVRALPVAELQEFYLFLEHYTPPENSPSPRKKGMKRPECPVRGRTSTGGQPTWDYKKEMAVHIDVKYGYRFNDNSIPVLASSFLEATVNYLEAKTR